MNTSSDDTGAERSPIVWTVPDPNELRSDEGSRNTTPHTPTETVCDAHKKRLASKAAYRARRSAMAHFVRLNVSERENGVVNTPTRLGPKRKRRAQRTITVRSSRSMPKGRDILARTSSTTACAILGTTHICGARRRMMVGLLRG